MWQVLWSSDKVPLSILFYFPHWQQLANMTVHHFRLSTVYVTYMHVQLEYRHAFKEQTLHLNIFFKCLPHLLWIMGHFRFVGKTNNCESFVFSNCKMYMYTDVAVDRFSFSYVINVNNCMVFDYLQCRSHMKCGTYMCLIGFKPPPLQWDPECVLESLFWI